MVAWALLGAALGAPATPAAAAQFMHTHAEAAAQIQELAKVAAATQIAELAQVAAATQIQGVAQVAAATQIQGVAQFAAATQIQGVAQVAAATQIADVAQAELELIAHTPFAPSMPSAYEMLISWSQVNGGKTYGYTHKRSYDLEQQVYRDDQMDGEKIVTSTVYRPSDKLAYQYGPGGCTTWDFESRIDGFPPVDGFAYNLTDKVGDEYSKTFYDATGKIQMYRLDVWFDGTTPAQYHNTADEGSTVGGVKTITNYAPKIDDKDRFTIPKEWGCKSKVEAAAELVLADTGACTADDATKINTVKFACDATSCAKKSFFKLDGTTKCIETTDGVSSGCANCFGQVAQCVLKNCALKCLTDPTAPACLSCGHAACDELGKTCTGQPIIPDCKSGADLLVV